MPHIANSLPMRNLFILQALYDTQVAVLGFCFLPKARTGWGSNFHMADCLRMTVVSKSSAMFHAKSPVCYVQNGAYGIKNPSFFANEHKWAQS